jgi:hypothetical protein
MLDFHHFQDGFQFLKHPDLCGSPFLCAPKQQHPSLDDEICVRQVGSSLLSLEVIDIKAHLMKPLSGTSQLARIIQEAFAAATYLGMSAALRSVGLLSILLNAPAESSHCTPCIQVHLRRPATNLYE